MKHRIFRAGLTALGATGIARWLAPLTRGQGAILMGHHVKAAEEDGFAPNRILTITPAFLDAVLLHVRARGYDILPLDAVPQRLKTPQERPFVALTFDDGYRDTVTEALPILRKHSAPFTLYVTTGFADGTAPLWWRTVEEALKILPDLSINGHLHPLKTDADRQKAFAMLMTEIRRMPALAARYRVAEIAERAGIDSLARTRDECLTWDDIRQLAEDPLCTIGAHTLTHPLLAQEDQSAAHREMMLSREEIETRIRRPVRHFAYPVGDPQAAGQREFALAKALGFTTAVTTRPGVLFEAHAAYLHALPRLSLNGLYQSVRDFDVLLSGTAFALFNRGRRVNVT